MTNSQDDENPGEDPSSVHNPLITPQAESRTASSPENDENPYATPLEIGKSESTVPIINVSTPWQGGWMVMLPLSVVVAVTLFALGATVQEPALAILFFPVAALFGLAFVVRMLHDKVQIAWGGYLAMTFVFGVATYLLFVPVCTVILLPAAFMSYPAGGEFIGVIAFVIVLSILAVAFTAMLRLYISRKYQKQVMHQIASGETSEKDLL